MNVKNEAGSVLKLKNEVSNIEGKEKGKSYSTLNGKKKKEQNRGRE
jgi:hypothetical protein